MYGPGNLEFDMMMGSIRMQIELAKLECALLGLRTLQVRRAAR